MGSVSFGVMLTFVLFDGGVEFLASSEFSRLLFLDFFFCFSGTLSALLTPEPDWARISSHVEEKVVGIGCAKSLVEVELSTMMLVTEYAFNLQTAVLKDFSSSSKSLESFKMSALKEDILKAS